MAKSWNRTETWLALGVGTVGLGLAGVLGLLGYTIATAPLHQEPQNLPSVTRSEPTQKWADPVSRGRELLRAALVDQNLPGLSVAVASGDEIIWAEGFGWADLEQRIPVGPETRFRIGTASKVLTSAAAGLLLEQGSLDLDAEIQTYVPEFPKKEWPVTLRHLMAQVAGASSDGGDEGPLFSERCARPVDALHAFADRPLLFEPGTAYRASSYGWILVSAAIEAAAGEPFLMFMDERIFKPLGMIHTRAESSTEPVPNRATFYFPRLAAEPRYGQHLMRPLEYSCYAGSSVFLSTPSDLVRFATAIANGKLLQPATVRMLQTPHRLVSGEETAYGLGWDVGTVVLAGERTRSIGHHGESLGGMVASLLALPERGIVVAVTSNISYADTSSLASRIAEAFAVAEQASISE